MAQFNCGTNATFTPTASNTVLSNGSLFVATAGQIARVVMISWGGDGTSLVGYITRWARVTTAPSGSPTNGLIGSTNPGVTPVGTFPVLYATTQPIAVLDTNLHSVNWNVQGGGGIYVLPQGGWWMVTGGALSTVYSQIGCGNTTGADANLSGYRMTWEE